MFLILRPDTHHFGTKGCTEETDYYWLHFQTSGNWHADEACQAPRREEAPELKAMTPNYFSVNIPNPAPCLNRKRLWSFWLPCLRWFSTVTRLNFCGGRGGVPRAHRATGRRIGYTGVLSFLRLRRAGRDLSAEALSGRVQGAGAGRPHQLPPCLYCTPHAEGIRRSPVEYLRAIGSSRPKCSSCRRTSASAGSRRKSVSIMQRYFTSCFTKQEGISPRKYRRDSS